MKYTLKLIDENYEMKTLRFSEDPRTLKGSHIMAAVLEQFGILPSLHRFSAGGMLIEPDDSLCDLFITNGSFIGIRKRVDTDVDYTVAEVDEPVSGEVRPAMECSLDKHIDASTTITVSSTVVKRSTLCYVDKAARYKLSTSKVDVLSEEGKGVSISIWPVYSSGAVLMAASGGSGTAQEVLSIRPTVVRGDPMCYRDVGCVSADGLAASLNTRAGVDTTMLLDSLAAEVHPSMVRLFARRLGMPNVEPVHLHQRVVDAMRSSSVVAVDCDDGSSWSLGWEYTSVGCSLVARVAQDKSAVQEVPKPKMEEELPPPEVATFGSRGGRGGRGGGGPDHWEEQQMGFRGGRGGYSSRGGLAGDDDWAYAGPGGARGGHFGDVGQSYDDYMQMNFRGRGGRGGRGRGGDYNDDIPTRGRGMRGGRSRGYDSGFS